MPAFWNVLLFAGCVQIGRCYIFQHVKSVVIVKISNFEFLNKNSGDMNFEILNKNSGDMNFEILNKNSGDKL